MALDECQLIPSLFPALKEAVRKNKKPGQYLMSGSVRFTSRKAIRESLTGRIINHELLPFTISEIKRLPLSDLCLQIIQKNLSEQSDLDLILSRTLKFDVNIEIEKYLIRGGLPSLCFTRDNPIRERKLLDQLNTILDRDIRLVYPTNLPYIQLFEYLRELALTEGKPLNFSNLHKKTKISDVTQKKLIYALESVFLIRILPLKGGKRNFVIRFEDQAESHYLRSIDNASRDLEIELEGLLYRHIRTQFIYNLGTQATFFQFQTRGGARIPIAIDTPDGTLGLIITKSAEPNRHQLASAASFLKSHSSSKIIYVSQESQLRPKLIDSRSFNIPLKYFI